MAPAASRAALPSRGMAYSILPVILTCDADVALTRTFATGFRNVQHALKPPVLLVDQSKRPQLSGEYLAQLASLGPQAVYVHPAEAGMSPYDSVQEAANHALALALQHAQAGDHVLFVEDDVVFSSRFAEKVANTYLGPETGFLTLYAAGEGYGSDVVAPSHFYGSQCLLFTRQAVAEIVHNVRFMMANFMPGYDIRWSRFLAHKGYILYTTDFSYVQHVPRQSRLHGHSGNHISNRFLP
jgi:hypothetical protein